MEFKVNYSKVFSSTGEDKWGYCQGVVSVVCVRPPVCVCVCVYPTTCELESQTSLKLMHDFQPNFYRDVPLVNLYQIHSRNFNPLKNISFVGEAYYAPAKRIFSRVSSCQSVCQAICLSVHVCLAVYKGLAGVLTLYLMCQF